MKYNPDIHHRHSIRLRNYNYANIGSYFVTICCQNRLHLFGNIVDGKMILNEYGGIAYNEWINTAKIRQNIKLHEFVIMPNHVHAIIEICGWGEGVCNTPLRRLQSPSNTIGAIVRGYKSAVTNQIKSTTPNNPNPPIYTTTQIYMHKCNEYGRMQYAPTVIWQRNYHEHIIRNETEFAKITEYIRNNPILWKKDRFNNAA